MSCVPSGRPCPSALCPALVPTHLVPWGRVQPASKPPVKGRAALSSVGAGLALFSPEETLPGVGCNRKMQRTPHHVPGGGGRDPREAGADAVWAGAWPSLPRQGRRTCVWDNRESFRPRSVRGRPGSSGGRRMRNQPCAAMCGRCGWFALGCRPGVSPRVPQSWAQTFWAWCRAVSHAALPSCS